MRPITSADLTGLQLPEAERNDSSSMIGEAIRRVALIKRIALANDSTNNAPTFCLGAHWTS